MKGKATRLLAALLLSVLVEGTALARDVYKGSLDPAIPRHQAVLDTLSRLEANPKDGGLKNDLGCLIAQEGFWRDALREFDEAADLDLKDGRPYFNAGLVKATKGEWRGARSYFQRATKRDPGNWPAWWMAGFAEEQLGNASAAVANYQVSLRVDTSLFDVAVNPFAAWTQLKARVFLESYDTRRARAALPTSEQLDDPERVIAFFQKSKKGALRAAAAPPPTPEPKTGPVISSAPAASSTAPPSRMLSGPTWNPQGPRTRQREETPPSATPPPAPAGMGADVGGPGIGGPGVGGPGIGGPGIGGPGIGGVNPPAPTPAPTPAPAPK